MIQHRNIYWITDGDLSLEDNLSVINVLGASGVGDRIMVQIRFPELKPGEMMRFIKEAQRVQGRLLLLINDRIDMVEIAGTDGIHLKESSIEPDILLPEIRRMGKIMGCSTHSKKRMETLLQLGVDFVTYGPVFETPSKLQYGAPAGVIDIDEHLRDRVYPLGGIDLKNIAALKAAGFNRVGLIRGLSRSGDPVKRAMEILEMLGV